MHLAVLAPFKRQECTGELGGVGGAVRGRRCPARGSVAERVSVPRPVGVSGVRVLRVLQLILQDIFVDHVSTCHRQFAARAPEPLAYGATGAAQVCIV